MCVILHARLLSMKVFILKKRQLLISTLVISISVLLTTWMYSLFTNHYYYMNFSKTRGLTVYDMYRSILVMMNQDAIHWSAKASETYQRGLKHHLDPRSSFQHLSISVIEKESFVEQCNCYRKINVTRDRNEHHAFLKNNTCSQHSHDRGPNQKIIGFSFYAGHPSRHKTRKYFQGIVDNLKQIPDLYPNWILRLYYDLEPDHPLMEMLCQLACNDSNIDLCPVRNIPAVGDIRNVFAMIWRFFPCLDGQVTHYLSRDLDSLLNAREVSAVVDWLKKSDSAFHFMRDHPVHSVEILGSAWGVRLRPIERSMMSAAFEAARSDSMYWAPRYAYGPDQGFLKRYVWPWAKWSSISHDSYFCYKFPFTRPFPSQRPFEDSNYVASIVHEHDQLEVQCPERCRPKHHKDWLYC